MVEIIVAVITGVLTLLGVIITNTQSNKKIEQKLQTAQAVTDCKLEEQINGIKDKIEYLHSNKAGE